MLATTRRAPYICTRCAAQQSRFFSSLIRDDHAPSPTTVAASGAAKLTNRRLISLHGPDVHKFLQGIITNNVQPESRAGFYAAFLNAQGRVLHDVFVYPTLGSQWHAEANRDGDPGYLVEVDANEAEVLFKHLKRHKLRSKFKLRLLDSGELNVWSVWNEGDRWTAHTTPQSANEEQGSLTLTDCRATGMGQRLLLSTTGGSNGWIVDVDEVPLSAYTIRRYLRGVAEGQKEIPRDESLPMNCNVDIMGGIDFKKGCYVGQELTIRTHHTGVVRRRILPVQLYDRNTAPPTRLSYDEDVSTLDLGNETEIRRDNERRRATGKLIARIGNVGLGMCRLEQMSDLVVSGEGSSFGPDDRFLLSTSDSGDIGVKAFVPDWLRGRIREPKIQKRMEL